MNEVVPVVWLAPPGWPAPAAGWYPSLEWLPDPTWPWPPPRHLFWSPIDVDAFLNSEEVEFPAEPDLSDVPLVWVPAPGWPIPAPGWYPDERWKPDKAWPRAPYGFQHWQPDPAVIAARRQRWWNDTIDVAAACLASLRARVAELSLLEWTWTSAWVSVRMLTPPLPIEVHFSAVLPLHHPARAAVADAERSALLAADEQRQSLLDPSSNRTAAERLAHASHRAQYSFRQLRQRLDELDAARLEYFVAARESALGTKRTSDPAMRYARLTELKANLNAYEYEHKRARTMYRRVLLGEDSREAPDFNRDAAWRRAEECAASHLRSLGFSDATATEVGADAGFDVVGRSVVAQVKYLASPVGRPVVQQLLGANTHGATTAIYSRSGYTKQALDFADQSGVALFTLELPDAVRAVNRHADRLLGTQ